MHCPLCDGVNYRLYHQDKKSQLNRDYYLCNDCDLVFVPPEQHLSVEAERQHYQNHQNEYLDAGYRAFLNRLFIPLSDSKPAPCEFLDFGSGSGAGLAVLASEAGYKACAYDPMFHPDKHLLEARYDLIAASEVIEHVVNVQSVFAQLVSMLKADSVLGIMTGSRPADFAAWYYKNDPTHVVFFSTTCFEWLANYFNLRIISHETNVWLLTKQR